MMVLGITGPTGSGKTTALMQLKKRGYHVIDCDRLYHQLLKTDEKLRSDLRAAFGDVFLPDGALDRKALAAIVFQDSKQLQKLDRIVNPAVCAAVEREIASCRGKGAAIDAINLIESGLGKLCDMTIAITADPAVRMKRIMARDNITREQAEARINAQKPDKFYRKNCTFLLENRAGSMAAFEQLIGEFLEDILFEM